MVHALRFEEHIRTAERLAEDITGVKVPMNYVWLTTITVDNTAEEGEDLMRFSAPEELDNREMVMEDLLEELEDSDDNDEFNSLREPFDGQDMEAANESVTFDAQDREPLNDSLTMDAVDMVDATPSPRNLMNAEDSDVEIVGGITTSESMVSCFISKFMFT
jgi:hypothetical protein